MNNSIKYSLLAAFPVVAGALAYKNYPKLNIISGFAAKNVCSCTFEAGRELQSILKGDNSFLPVNYAESKINFQERSVTSSFLGMKERKAIYIDGVGSVLLPEKLGKSTPSLNKPNRKIKLDNAAYPYGNAQPEISSFSNVDYEKLQENVGKAFDVDGKELQRTRAVVVLHKDHLIAEQYSAGFSADTKLLGWSMTKSLTNAALGILEKQGKVKLEQNHLFEEWENDERKNITLNNLLQMNSGLQWDEDYTNLSDVNKMLFLEEDMPQVPLNKPLAGKPNESWNYSSGTTNLLSKFIRMQFDTHQEYLDFWYEELIDKIGMNSMTVETDLAGNYVTSSYGWATARDWAKFGLLYRNKGNWKGEQIFNESWAEYTATPTNGSNGEYGAHFWLNAKGKFPNVPKDLFSCNGFQGQFIFVIPSKDLVVVRFGLTEDPEFNVDTFLKGIIEAVG
ncbi:serine hydrolase domain-containing protein [Salinimicrobium sp. GXAS 041]|uniref:serine hydrolase domain-containing protein n=1 Tax=Salinimicrobium sp. GXAS 041 TaxID=3400806 RepID=UPI003C784AB9